MKRFMIVVCLALISLSHSIVDPDCATIMAPYMKPYIGSFPEKCKAMPPRCISGIMSGTYEADTTYDDAEGQNAWYSSSFGYAFFESSLHFKGIQLRNATSYYCDSVNVAAPIDSNFILFPDSIPVAIGDTVQISKYSISWIQPEAGSLKYIVSIDQGSFTVNSTTYECPVSIQAHSLSSRTSAISILRSLEGIWLHNLDVRPHQIRLLGIDGRVLQIITLTPGEIRKVTGSPAILVQGL